MKITGIIEQENLINKSIPLEITESMTEIKEQSQENMNDFDFEEDR